MYKNNKFEKGKTSTNKDGGLSNENTSRQKQINHHGTYTNDLYRKEC
jgi:hypothetical protein